MILLGASVALMSPVSATPRLVLAASLIGAGVGLMAAHGLAAPLVSWRGLTRRAVTVLGFGAAAGLSYLAVGWLPLALLAGVAVAASGGAAVRRIRTETGL